MKEGGDKTLQYVKANNCSHTSSKEKIGVCFSVNLAAKKTTKNYIVYAHYDMHFLQKWNLVLKNEILKFKNNLFYLSGAMMRPKEHIDFDCGNAYQNDIL